jgi:hypothetical protein
MSLHVWLVLFEVERPKSRPRTKPFNNDNSLSLTVQQVIVCSILTNDSWS